MTAWIAAQQDTCTMDTFCWSCFYRLPAIGCLTQVASTVSPQTLILKYELRCEFNPEMDPVLHYVLHVCHDYINFVLILLCQRMDRHVTYTCLLFHVTMVFFFSLMWFSSLFLMVRQEGTLASYFFRNNYVTLKTGFWNSVRDAGNKPFIILGWSMYMPLAHTHINEYRNGK